MGKGNGGREARETTRPGVCAQAQKRVLIGFEADQDREVLFVSFHFWSDDAVGRVPHLPNRGGRGSGWVLLKIFSRGEVCQRE